MLQLKQEITNNGILYIFIIIKQRCPTGYNQFESLHYYSPLIFF